MKVQLKKLTPEEWYRYAEECHRLIFKTQRDPWIDRISYAFLAYDDSGPIGYVTCRELDRDSLYWQYGGAIEERRGVASVRTFDAILEEARSKYRRVTTYVENNNVGYLHLLMKQGFRVVGMRVFEGKIYLELFIEFGG